MSDKVLYQSTVHGTGRLTLRYNKDGTVDKYRNTAKRVRSDRPFQSDSSGAGIGGERRRRKIDSIVDDAS